MTNKDQEKITWQAPEFEHRPKTVTWYWASIVISALLLILAIWQENYVFGVFVVIAEIMLMVWGSYEPPMITFTLDQKGLRVGKEKFYTYSSVENWSGDSEGFFDPEWPDIFFNIEGRFHTGIRVKVPRVMFAEVEEFLRDKAEEVPFEPTMVDVLEKYLGF